MKKNRTKSYHHKGSAEKKSKDGWRVKPSNIEMTTVDTVRVIYEDNHIIALNKRPSDIIQSDKTEDTCLSDILSQYLAKKYNKPGNAYVATVHRIDRPVSGIILYGKTSKAASRLSNMFRLREVTKTYWAVVENPPPRTEDSIVNYLKKNSDRNKSYVYHQPRDGAKKSELSYKYVGAGDKYHFVEIYPKTGRHHQIRTTLSDIGCPIKGDIKYMSKRTNPDASVCLHARKLEFIHPVKKEPISIVAPPPENPLWDEFLRQNDG